MQGKEAPIPEQKCRLHSLAETVKQLVDIFSVNYVNLIIIAKTEAVVAQQIQGTETFVFTKTAVTEFLTIALCGLLATSTFWTTVL